jgi:hypothetical protein
VLQVLGGSLDGAEFSLVLPTLNPSQSSEFPSRAYLSKLGPFFQACGGSFPGLRREKKGRRRACCEPSLLAAGLTLSSLFCPPAVAKHDTICIYGADAYPARFQVRHISRRAASRAASRKAAASPGHAAHPVRAAPPPEEDNTDEDGDPDFCRPSASQDSRPKRKMSAPAGLSPPAQRPRLHAARGSAAVSGPALVVPSSAPAPRRSIQTTAAEPAAAPAAAGGSAALQAELDLHAGTLGRLLRAVARRRGTQAPSPSPAPETAPPPRAPPLFLASAFKRAPPPPLPLFLGQRLQVPRGLQARAISDAAALAATKVMLAM